MEKNLRQLHLDKLYWAAFLAALLFVLGVSILFDQPMIINWLPWQMFIYMVLFYPLLEEIVFRGLVQEYIYQKAFGKVNYYGLSRANITTSIFFVLAHFVYHEMLWALAIIFPSLVFGFFRDRYQSIWPGVILHVWYNFIYFLFFTTRFHDF